MAGGTIRVEVVYALPERQELVSVTLARGATVADAIAASHITDRCPGAWSGDSALGIWGRRVEPDETLGDGDRVEIYRRLRADPREARRRLAAHGKAMGQHDEDEA